MEEKAWRNEEQKHHRWKYWYGFENSLNLVGTAIAFLSMSKDILFYFNFKDIFLRIKSLVPAWMPRIF